VYPEFIVQELIKLLTKYDDVALDPFLGSGATALAAERLNRILGFTRLFLKADIQRGMLRLDMPPFQH
jgi:hypothetical protein